MSATHVTAGGIAPSYGYFKFMPDMISVTPLLVGRRDILTWKEVIEPQLEMAGLMGFAAGTVATPSEHYPDMDDASADGRPGDNDRLQQLGVTTSCHDEDVWRATLHGVVRHPCPEGAPEQLISYILRDKAMQEGEQTLELLLQANYVASAKQGGRPGQRGQSSGGGSSGSRPAKDADKKKSAKDSGRGGGSRRREVAEGGRPGVARRASTPRKEKQSTESSTSAKDADSSEGGKGREDKEASCSLVGVVEPTVSLAPEAGEDFQAMATAVHVNLAVVLLDSGCSHHLMGTREVFVDLQPSGDVKHVRGFNEALQDVQGWGTVALQGEAGKQLKENGVKLQEDGNGMLLIMATGDVLGRASYTGRVLCTDLILARRSRSAKHEVATGLDLKSASGADSPCVLCIGRKLALHTFPVQGSDADDVLAVVHIDLCRPFRVTAKDGSLYFLLLKDRKTRYVWVRLVAKKSDVLREFVQWLAVAQRQTKKSVLMLPEWHGRAGDTHGGGVAADDAAAHGRTAPLVAPRSTAGRLGPQLPGVVEVPPGTTPYQLLTRQKPDLSMVQVWGCMVQFLVPEQQRGGKLKPKARWSLHLGVSKESKGWELLDITDNRVVTTSDVVFYETMSLEVWKSEHGPASGRTQANLPTDTLTATLPLLAEVGEPAAEDVEDVPSPFPSLPFLPLPLWPTCMG
ncbi:unnamed protein product [Closterium sp. NIES-54]